MREGADLTTLVGAAHGHQAPGVTCESVGATDACAEAVHFVENVFVES